MTEQKALPELNPGIEQFRITHDVGYTPQGREVVTFLRAYANGFGVILKGPTGSGKSTLVEHVAYLLGVGHDELEELYKKDLSGGKAGTVSPWERIEERVSEISEARGGGFPLLTVLGHEDLDADSLKGRPYVIGDVFYWLSGQATLAAEYGGLFYFDEPAEARRDTLTVTHSLSDHRRELMVEGLARRIDAHPGFGFAMSYNEKYQDRRKRFKPSTKQRFVHLPLGYSSDAAWEQKLVMDKGKVPSGIAKSLVKVAVETRTMAAARKIDEGASPRALLMAAQMIASGEKPYDAAMLCIAHALTEEPAELSAIEQLITNQFKR